MNLRILNIHAHGYTWVEIQPNSTQMGLGHIAFPDPITTSVLAKASMALPDAASNAVHMGQHLGIQLMQQQLGKALGDPGKSRCADVSCRSALVGHLFSSRHRNSNLSRSC